MNCSRARRHLGRHLDGESTDLRVARRLHEHLATCESCRRQLDDLRALRRLLSPAKAVRAPGDFAERLLAMVPLRERPAAWKRRAETLAFGVVAAAAGALLALALRSMSPAGFDPVGDLLLGEVVAYETAPLPDLRYADPIGVPALQTPPVNGAGNSSDGDDT
jgi:predicted anti-sigma-YlaC factor YlaD